jgi:general secretion pathway protein L
VFATVAKGLQDYVLRGCGVVEHYKELPHSDLYAWVQQFAEANGFDRQNVILGLPRDQVVLRQIELPLDVEENLEQVVRFQVDKFQPVEEGQSYCDYIVLERDTEAKKIVLQTLMVPKPVVDECLDLFHELNLYPAAIRVSSVGLFHVFSAHEDSYPKKNPSLVVDLALDGVEFILVGGPEKFFSEKVLLDQDDLSFERLLQELERFFDHLDLADEGIEKIYLSGPLADHFIDDFRAKFGDCELLSERLNLKRNGDSGDSDMSSQLGAIGLAISGTSKSRPGKLNLIPPEKRVIAERPSLVATLLLVGLLVIMGLAVTVREYLQQRQFLGQVEAQIEALQARVDETMILRSQRDQQQAELDELRALITGQQRVLLVLKELTERIPENSFLQNLNIQGDRISMTGFSSSASALLKTLLDSQYLESVESRYITPDRTMQNREKFSFEATFREGGSEESAE